MTSILNNMEKADFIYREKVLTAGQKHAHKIYLTTKGKKTAEEVYSEFEKLEEICLNGFSEKEKILCICIFDKIITIFHNFITIKIRKHLYLV